MYVYACILTCTTCVLCVHGTLRTQISNITSVTKRTRIEYKALQHIMDSEESESEFAVDDLYTLHQILWRIHIRPVDLE